MRVFITGATGFIGSAVIPELLRAGHVVTGLARSDAGARALAALGAGVRRGELEDLDSLRRGAADVDGVIHCGFVHDFSRFAENCEIDRRAIEALGDALGAAGPGRRLVVTSGTGVPAPGQLRTEQDPPAAPSAHMPRVSEQTGLAQQAKGVHVSVMRLPQVHDPLRQGLVSYAIELARAKGVSAYVGAGLNRWPAVHRSAAARLYRLVLEQGAAGASYNAVAEEGVAFRAIAEAMGRGMKLPVVSVSPEEAGAHFGWLAGFVTLDMPASSALTRQRLGWVPSGPGMIEDLGVAGYLAG